MFSGSMISLHHEPVIPALAEIQHLALHHLTAATSLVLDNIPIAMLFAVFEASIVSQEHDADDVG